MSPRKRRRSQAFQEADEVELGKNEVGLRDDILEKEREIWEVFREEYFEVVDQVPLTLHRQYTLMHELEQQAHSYMKDLFVSLKEYITKRQDMELPTGSPWNKDRHDGANASPVVNGVSPQRTDFTLEIGPSIAAFPDEQAPQGSVSRLVPNAVDFPPEHKRGPHTTREMLSHIAWLAEEFLRASDEKVNLAQAAHETVDRHSRILDQAIKEQEASISSSARPGHLAANNLPDLVVPRWARRSQALMSPAAGDKFESSEDEELYDLDAAKPLEPLLDTGRRNSRGKWVQRLTANEGDQLPGPETSLTITLPAQSGEGFSEQTFCHCNQVSYGEMIGCDNEGCKREWFHLGCLGLNQPPKGRWFCSSQCENAAKRRRR